MKTKGMAGILHLAVIMIVIFLLLLLPSSIHAMEFRDTEGHWAEAAIDRWSSYGIVNGRGDGIFDPGANMTRAEAAAVFVRLFGLSEQGDLSGFQDIPEGEGNVWKAEALSKCVAAGVMNGVGDGRMNPEGSISREQFFVMLGRALCMQEEETANRTIPDSNAISLWAVGMINAMVNRGYIKGVDGEGSVAPGGEINRASVMSLLNQTIAAYANVDGMDLEVSNDGITLIAAKDVTIQSHADAAGDDERINILVAAGAADGNVILENVMTGGVVTINARVNLTLVGTSSVRDVQLTANATSTVIEVESGAKIDTVDTKAAGTVIFGNGAVARVLTTREDTEVNTVGTEKTTTTINPDGSTNTQTVITPAPGGSDGSPRLVYSGQAICYDEYYDEAYDDYWEFDDYKVRLQVVTRNGEIIEIRNIAGYDLNSGKPTNGTNASYLGIAAAKLPERIIQTQSTDVDAVSGATFASHAICRAVEEALKTEPEIEADNSDPNPDKEPVADGIYRGSAQCLTGYMNYMVDVEVTVENDRITGITDRTLQMPMSAKDRELYAKAWTGILESVASVGSKASDFRAVDAVSGATISSAGINNAIGNALETQSAATRTVGDVYAPEGISLYACVYPVVTVSEGTIREIRIIPVEETNTELLSDFAEEIRERQSVTGLHYPDAIRDDAFRIANLIDQILFGKEVLK